MIARAQAHARTNQSPQLANERKKSLRTNERARALKLWRALAHSQIPKTTKDEYKSLNDYPIFIWPLLLRAAVASVFAVYLFAYAVCRIIHMVAKRYAVADFVGLFFRQFV